MFHFSVLASTLLEIVEEDTVKMGLNTHDQILQVRTLDRILGRLLADLVPIRGQAIDYRTVELNGKEWIVHRRLVDQLKAFYPNLMVHPLYVVGVAEQSLFWKDIRRVLFSNARFSVFCRLAKDGVHSSWTPVKLTQVLEKIVPDLAFEIKNLETGLLNALSVSNQSDETIDGKQERMQIALRRYAQFLAGHYQYSVTSQDLADIESLASQHGTSHSSLNERRKAFNAIATFLRERIGSELQPLVIAKYRDASLKDAGLDFSGNIIPSVGSTGGSEANSVSPQTSHGRFIDSEFIAIYW
jgi:hypothetical protein